MMDLVCGKCGHTDKKIEFAYLSKADSAGAATYRRCPKCGAPVFCEEAEDAEDYASGRVWGTSALRGRTFTKDNRPPRRPTPVDDKPQE